MWLNSPNFDNSHHAQLDVDIQNRKNEGTKHQYRVIHLKVYTLKSVFYKKILAKPFGTQNSHFLPH